MRGAVAFRATIARQVRIVTGAACYGARTATATIATTLLTAAAGAAMFGPAARILVRLIFAGLGAPGARRVGTFLDLELRRRRELHLALEHLFDIPEQRHFIRGDE